jgi:NifU-like protein involved in Fe-S cluster formation
MIDRRLWVCTAARPARCDIVRGAGPDKKPDEWPWTHGLYKQMTQLSEIYNKRILELSAHIPRAERLAEADGTATAHSKLCGSTVTVDLVLAGDRVNAYGQTVKACLLGQAAASVMGHNILGTSATELREVGAAMRKMLKAGGPPPEGRWADLAVLQPVKDYKARHASTLLVFDAVESALAAAEAKHASKGEASCGAAATAAERV